MDDYFRFCYGCKQDKPLSEFAIIKKYEVSPSFCSFKSKPYTITEYSCNCRSCGTKPMEEYLKEWKQNF